MVEAILFAVFASQMDLQCYLLVSQIYIEPFSTDDGKL